MKINISAKMYVPVTFSIDVDADTLGEIATGDLSSIKDQIEERLVDAEGKNEIYTEVVITDNNYRCYFDDEM